jgi:bifunctional DNA-binding transcriptional regulator/antitoxin component of YhaV-PrlF toxin-antitoxin module
MSWQSNAIIARAGTTSLRATIPEGIVKLLGIKEGDTLDWTVEFTKDGKRMVIVRKAKKS